MTEKNNAKLLELAPAELALRLKVTHAGRTYRLRHLLRPPTTADWLAYEAALEMAVEELPPGADSEETSFRLHVRSADAALELWGRLALRVEGYDLTRDASQDENWRSLIPLAHKEAAVNSLTLVATAETPAGADTDNYFPLLAEEVPLVLEAVVAGVAYPRLVHRLRSPSVKAERTYRRLLAETLIVRGSRTPRTLLPPRLPGLVKLYDQLILGVEGYCLHGEPLASSLQAIQSMDAWHKRVAAQTLFGDLLAPPMAEPTPEPSTSAPAQKPA
jgi:hypothetical protein